MTLRKGTDASGEYDGDGDKKGRVQIPSERGAREGKRGRKPKRTQKKGTTVTTHPGKESRPSLIISRKKTDWKDIILSGSDS